ncbi:hypothetical protein [Nocardioides sp. BYT-33-1]|uniref:hypothetical protein n=1 Tax=Nocardioides sp. BYT-33-1 TaxID=3416952 RepID=UPI003F53AEDC
MTALVASWLTMSTVSPAHADNPPCDTGFTAIAVHVSGSEAFRAKACWREPKDNWEFQDTYVDSWSAVFYYPNNAITTHLEARDTDGANNGWNKLLMAYPEDVDVTVQLCSHDYSAGVPHGCTGVAGILT